MDEDRRHLVSGLSQAAWGYLFLHIDLNIGPVNFLPRFVGYLLLLAAIGKLSKERRELRLLRPICIMLAIWNAADWLAAFGGISLDGRFAPVDILVAVAGLYLHFQFLTDMAALAGRYQPQGAALDRRLLNCRTVYVTLMALSDILFNLPLDLQSTGQSMIAIFCGLAGVIAALAAMFGLFSLRKTVATESAAN